MAEESRQDTIVSELKYQGLISGSGGHRLYPWLAMDNGQILQSITYHHPEPMYSMPIVSPSLPFPVELCINCLVQ
jgi:hypothetical protein